MHCNTPESSISVSAARTAPGICTRANSASAIDAIASGSLLLVSLLLRLRRSRCAMN
jgi:hypothetical protein